MSGIGKAYDSNGKLTFEGEYLNNQEWIGTAYDGNNNIIYELNYINGIRKEYYDNGQIKLEG